jgi:hypothetical protein
MRPERILGILSLAAFLSVSLAESERPPASDRWFSLESRWNAVDNIRINRCKS